MTPADLIDTATTCRLRKPAGRVALRGRETKRRSARTKTEENKGSSHNKKMRAICRNFRRPVRRAVSILYEVRLKNGISSVAQEQVIALDTAFGLHFLR
ncbi:hypothetical protein NECAME_00279 [Necator americanus]|uniref:Uncharacterized protein n=1 Tax=Necator americanus TaxID=51031 RepID=W2TJF2_NECAM|nr:hypothetical protein NECAME_00279 [Necator americanus]ETN81928.1 hypothetical protein NECAME_00279 [Necator americanus]